MSDSFYKEVQDGRTQIFYAQKNDLRVIVYASPPRTHQLICVLGDPYYLPEPESLPEQFSKPFKIPKPRSSQNTHVRVRGTSSKQQSQVPKQTKS